jgi:predicted acyltransferase
MLVGHLFPRSPTRGRLLSLDVFRGVVIAAMILVTDPGTYTYTWHQLRHAEWNGATATDMIFPAFLFMVGLAIPFSLGSRAEPGTSRRKTALRIIRRSITLFLLGLGINGFPDYVWNTLRLPGILQRIAVCYALCGFLYLAVRERRQRDRTIVFASVSIVLLASYWAMLKFIEVPGIGRGHLDPYGALPAVVDRAVFGANHLWQWGIRTNGNITYDPEGLLSTLPALVPTLVGMAVGGWIQLFRTASSAAVRALGSKLLLLGAGLMVTGLALSPWLPINKSIFTSTFALFSTGVSLLVLGLLHLLVDGYDFRRGITPALILGTNAILAFVVSSIITTMLDLIHVSSITLHAYLYWHMFAPWLPPTLGSHTYALAIVVLNIALLYPLYHRRIFLRL